MKAFPRSSYKEVSGDGYLKRIVLEAEDIGVKGTLLQEVQFMAGDHVSFHYHQVTREIFFCLQGPAPFVINGTPALMNQGDCLVCEPGDVHGNPVIEHDFRILVLKVGYRENDTVWLDQAIVEK